MPLASDCLQSVIDSLFVQRAERSKRRMIAFETYGGHGIGIAAYFVRQLLKSRSN